MKTLVSKYRKAAEELPLIHTSRCEYLNDIVNKNALVPRHCPVFRKSLVYMFYGKPAYTSTRGISGGDPISLCPICFVFKPRTVSKTIYRVYPCDTGAVKKNLFCPEINAKDINKLELSPTIVSARKAVSLFFKNNTCYFEGIAAMGRNFTPGSLEERFYKLLIKSGPVPYDERRSAIEVQANSEVPLIDNLLFVVLPQIYLKNSKIRDVILNVWNCDPIPYSTSFGAQPAKYYGSVWEIVAKKLKEATRI